MSGTTTTLEPRKALLSDEEIIERFRVKHDVEPDGFAHGVSAVNVAMHVRAFYENLITSGELRVVETVKLIKAGRTNPSTGESKMYDTCPNCNAIVYVTLFGVLHTRTDFCPGCGAKIIP